MGDTLMKAHQRYQQAVLAHLQMLAETQGDAIARAAALVARSVSGGGVLYAIGTGGHSMIGAEELFYRAGGLLPVSAVLDEGFWLGSGALRSTRIERLPGYARAILQDYPMTPRDVLVIINAYGINAATIDAALYGKEMGVPVIAVTSIEHAKRIPADHPARHPSRTNLFELADVCLDSRVPVGDALVRIDGVELPVGPVSTLASTFLLNSVVCLAVEMMHEMGAELPIWKSANAPGGDEANRRWIEKYRGRIRKL